jgi:plastocyanin domain-containing protein
LLNLPLPKQIFCNGLRLKANTPNLFSNPFYIITGEVPVHMQMEINGPHNNDTMKIAPLFWRVKKILTGQSIQTCIKAFLPINFQKQILFPSYW